MKNMKKEQGFTLIELLIVVAIIAIIAAIAIPNLVNARKAANEASAIAALRAIASAQVSYSAEKNTYGTLDDLIAGGYLDDRFGSTDNKINGYTIDVIGSTNPCGTVLTGRNLTTFPGRSSGTTPGYSATPDNNSGRYTYGLYSDLTVRYLGATATNPGGAEQCAPVGGGTKVVIPVTTPTGS